MGLWARVPRALVVKYRRTHPLHLVRLLELDSDHFDGSVRSISEYARLWELDRKTVRRLVAEYRAERATWQLMAGDRSGTGEAPESLRKSAGSGQMRDPNYTESPSPPCVAGSGPPSRAQREPAAGRADDSARTGKAAAAARRAASQRERTARAAAYRRAAALRAAGGPRISEGELRQVELELEGLG